MIITNIAEHHKEISDMEKVAKTIRKQLSPNSPKDDTYPSVYQFICDYWERARTLITEHTGFDKPSKLNKFICDTIELKTGCPLLFQDDENGYHQLGIFKIFNLEDTQAPLISSRTGRMVRPYKLDTDGKVVKVPKFKVIKTWTVEIVIELILQIKFFNNILSKKGYDIESEMSILKTYNDFYLKDLKKEESKRKRPYVHFISVPMGGQNRKS